MKTHPFYSLLLMYLRFKAVDSVKKMSTDGHTVYFAPSFLEKLRAEEVDFVLCHQIMHILSGDIWRPGNLEGDDYHFACDIIINNQMEELEFQTDNLTHLGEVQMRIPGSLGSVSGLSRMQVYSSIPFSLYALPDNARERYLIDSDSFWGNTDRSAEGDLVLGISSEDGVLYRDQENCLRPCTEKSGTAEVPSDIKGPQEGTLDQYDLTFLWQSRAIAASQAVKKRGKGQDALTSPFSLRELLKIAKKPIIDWRRILNEFLQEEICDYSFSPPDRRYSDSDFFLPDYNEREVVFKDILFMIDSSGSMEEEEMADAFSEIKGAIEQFNGKLCGKLGFFDTSVTPPIPFSDVESLEKILPYGGGGTSFGAIFDYIDAHPNEERPTCIIILTDGYADFPYQEAARGIPVLWMINNCDVTPPWGRVARLIR